MNFAKPLSVTALAARRTLAAAAACLLASLPVRAEDIDIFSAKPPPAERPNILLILDNSSNWNSTLGANPCGTGDTKFAAEVCALNKVVPKLQTDVRLGLMLFAESGENGGYVRFAIRDVGPSFPNNAKALIEMFNGFVRQGSGTDNSGSNQPYGKVMFEAFSKLGCGNEAFAGWTKDQSGGAGTDTDGSAGGDGTWRRDYAGSKSPAPSSAEGIRSAEVYGADSNTAFKDKGTTTYTSPILSNCAKNFIIFISNGNPSVGGDAGGIASATTLLTNVGGNTAQITSSGVAIHANTMDEWARFLFSTDVSDRPDKQTIVTYTIGVYQPTGWRVPTGTGTYTTVNTSIPPAKCQPDPTAAGCLPIASNTDSAMIRLMQSAATAGGGIYFDGYDASRVEAALNRILIEIQAVNSVFVSASLPVSVNTQGTFLNQVYMGMFRPDALRNPRWNGNLKQYKIDVDGNGNIFLADSNLQEAVAATTGFITPTAVSFWTQPSTFWKNAPSGDPASESDSPDGAVVEKGGTAEQQRIAFATSHTSRRVYTCPIAGCPKNTALSTTQFDTNTISGATFETEFKVASAGELSLLVNWIRGEDNVRGIPCNPAIATTPPCTWGSAERGPGWPTTVRPSLHGDVLHSRPVVINYPDKGPYLFYASNSDGVLRSVKGGRLLTDGNEIWSFVAPETFGKFKRHRDATPLLKLNNLGDGEPKDYFMDGSIGFYQSKDFKTNWIFVSARRGGRFIYAIDVSDPENPIFMWSKTEKDLPELGQTWSEPKAFTVEAQSDPVVMFGAGYDPAEDSVPPGNTTMGRGIYVLNAKTGDLVKFFQSSENGGSIATSVPSDIGVIDRDFDGFADRGYVGDMKGNVWRVDFHDKDVSNWKMYKFAELGETRKFFFRPDVVITKEYDLILIGSGDREKPLDEGSKDRFYMLKETNIAFTAPLSVTVLKEGDLAAGSPDNTSAIKGWYIDMREGEKVINAPLSIAGTTFFGTNQPIPPDPEKCTPGLGAARSYAVNFVTGGPGLDRNGDGQKNSDDLSVDVAGGGLPPSPVVGIVQLDPKGPNDPGQMVPICFGCGPDLDPTKIEIPIPKVRKKIYWNTNIDKQ